MDIRLISILIIIYYKEIYVPCVLCIQQLISNNHSALFLKDMIRRNCVQSSFKTNVIVVVEEEVVVDGEEMVVQFSFIFTSVVRKKES